MSKFEEELTALINKHSLENESDTPDFILAQFMCRQLDTFNVAVRHREDWYGRVKQSPEIQATNKLNSIPDPECDLSDITGRPGKAGSVKDIQTPKLDSNGVIDSGIEGLSIRQSKTESTTVRTATLGGRAYAGPGSPRHPYDRPDGFWVEP